MNDDRNGDLYARYSGVRGLWRTGRSSYGGRLGEYRFCDMDQVIASALRRSEGLVGA